jgi:hypothetical protein
MSALDMDRRIQAFKKCSCVLLMMGEGRDGEDLLDPKYQKHNIPVDDDDLVVVSPPQNSPPPVKSIPQPLDNEIKKVHSDLSVCISNFCLSRRVTSYLTMCGSRSSNANRGRCCCGGAGGDDPLLLLLCQATAVVAAAVTNRLSLYSIIACVTEWTASWTATANGGNSRQPSVCFAYV